MTRRSRFVAAAVAGAVVIPGVLVLLPAPYPALGRDCYFIATGVIVGMMWGAYAMDTSGGPRVPLLFTTAFGFGVAEQILQQVNAGPPFIQDYCTALGVFFVSLAIFIYRRDKRLEREAAESGSAR